MRGVRSSLPDRCSDRRRCTGTTAGGRMSVGGQRFVDSGVCSEPSAARQCRRPDRTPWPMPCLPVYRAAIGPHRRWNATGRARHVVVRSLSDRYRRRRCDLHGRDHRGTDFLAAGDGRVGGPSRSWRQYDRNRFDPGCRRLPSALNVASRPVLVDAEAGRERRAAQSRAGATSATENPRPGAGETASECPCLTPPTPRAVAASAPRRPQDRNTRSAGAIRRRAHRPVMFGLWPVCALLPDRSIVVRDPHIGGRRPGQFLPIVPDGHVHRLRRLRHCLP